MPMSGSARERKPIGSFAIALATNQATMGMDNSANRHPAGLACHERPIRPRTNQANEVVIPQVGQSRPVTTANAQGPSPSWVCVPKPRGSGSSRLANPKIPAHPAAATSSKHRAGRPNGCRADWCVIMGGPELEWMIANGSSSNEGLGKVTHSTAKSKIRQGQDFKVVRPRLQLRGWPRAFAARPRAGKLRWCRGRRRWGRARPAEPRTPPD
jgi:hypothetical protein